MTPLANILARRIKTTGPISLADYMAECLMHPEYGYYTTRAPFGAKGDFTTAPEISQMFGELLGLCLAQSWLDQGAPGLFALAEIGPGRGTLMADALRATKGVPGFHAALQVHLIEASPRLREAQRAALSGFDPVWHDDVSALPELPLFLIANEFFDALPIRQFQRSESGWRERMISLHGDRLVFGLGPESGIAALNLRLADTQTGDVIEICPAAAPVMQMIGHHLATHGGTALIVDYGDWHLRGDTFQALRGHTYTDPLLEPGLADLTAHVDFEALAHAAPESVACCGPVAQGVFLSRLGIAQRTNALARNLTGPALENHLAAHRRLTDPKEMGSLFKVLGLHRSGNPPPPGFAHDA